MQSPQSIHLLRRWAPRCVLQTLRVLHPWGNGEGGHHDTRKGAADIEDTTKEHYSRSAGPPQLSAAPSAGPAFGHVASNWMAYEWAVHATLVMIPRAAESRCWAEGVRAVCDFLDSFLPRRQDVGSYRVLLLVPMLWALVDAVLRSPTASKGAAAPAMADLLARLALQRFLPPSVQVAAGVLAIVARPLRGQAWIGAAHETTTMMSALPLATFFAPYVTPRLTDHSSE
jgi:hypothetical protein